MNRTDAGVRIALRPWCKAEDCWQVQYEVYRALLERFREQDIPIAYPVREIRTRPAKACAAARHRRFAVLFERTRLSGLGAGGGVFHFPLTAYLPIVIAAGRGFH